MNNAVEFIRVQCAEMYDKFQSTLLRYNFNEDKASLCADVFTTNSLEGIYTHGVNRFSRFVQYVQHGYINPFTEAVLKSKAGTIEQWNGQLGAGPINAIMCTERAIAIASESGMGCVALSNTNHWMRGGFYGWRAAQKNYVLIAWTNTTGNMPAWGAIDSRLGNNPIVIAVPHKDQPIVLDMAMSQYSYGALDLYQSKNQTLPVIGGYNVQGKLTDNPAEIISSRRVLPIGYWKGAGLSLLLDILAAILSNGMSTAQISKLNAEHSVSQVFIALDISRLNNYSSINKIIDNIIDDYKNSEALGEKEITYPGQRALHMREENLKHGIPVSAKVWEEILKL